MLCINEPKSVYNLGSRILITKYAEKKYRQNYSTVCWKKQLPLLYFYSVYCKFHAHTLYFLHLPVIFSAHALEIYSKTL